MRARRRGRLPLVGHQGGRPGPHEHSGDRPSWLRRQWPRRQWQTAFLGPAVARRARLHRRGACALCRLRAHLDDGRHEAPAGAGLLKRRRLKRRRGCCPARSVPGVRASNQRRGAQRPRVRRAQSGPEEERCDMACVRPPQEKEPPTCGSRGACVRWRARARARPRARFTRRGSPRSKWCRRSPRGWAATRGWAGRLLCGRARPCSHTHTHRPPGAERVLPRPQLPPAYWRVQPCQRRPPGPGAVRSLRVRLVR